MENLLVLRGVDELQLNLGCHWGGCGRPLALVQTSRSWRFVKASPDASACKWQGEIVGWCGRRVLWNVNSWAMANVARELPSDLACLGRRVHSELGIWPAVRSSRCLRAYGWNGATTTFIGYKSVIDCSINVGIHYVDIKIWDQRIKATRLLKT